MSGAPASSGEPRRGRRSQGAEVNGAFGLTATVSERSPFLSPAEKALLSAYLDGCPETGFPAGKTIVLTADVVNCRISNVYITAKNCDLTFSGSTVVLPPVRHHCRLDALCNDGLADVV